MSDGDSRAQKESREAYEAALVNKITTSGTNVIVHIILAHVGDVRDKTIAETGCGNARGTLLFSQAVGPKGLVLASDSDRSMVSNAQENLKEAGVQNVHVEQADCRDLRYIESESVDVVVSNLLLHLVPHPERVIQEAKRILKPGGVFALSCAGPARDENCFIKAVTNAIGSALGDSRRAEEWVSKTNQQGSVGNVCRLLTEAGFHDIFGWQQDVALSVSTMQEATILVKANAFTRTLVPLDKRDRLDLAVNAWAYSLLSSQRQPMFGSNCFKARKPFAKPRLVTQ